MYFSSLYRRGVKSSQTKTCCLPSIILSSRLLVRNSFLFLYDTNLAMIGRGFSLFLLFSPSQCSLCISLSSANSIASQLVKNGAHKTGDREPTRLVNKELSDLWKIPTPEGSGDSRMKKVGGAFRGQGKSRGAT